MPSNITNIKFRSAAPNFERDQLKTIQDLYNANIGDYDVGHIVYCVDDENHYSFKPLWTNGSFKKRDKTGHFLKFAAGETGAKGKDGDGVQYIYRNSKGVKNSGVTDSEGNIILEPANLDGSDVAWGSPTPNDWENNKDYQDPSGDYIPSGWSDIPIGVSEASKYAWIWVRKFIGNKWWQFEGPTLWCNYAETGPKGDKGDQGIPGESIIGSYTVFAYCTSVDKPARPVGGGYDFDDLTIEYPTDPDKKIIWEKSDNIEKPVWMSSADFIRGEGIRGQWSDPFMISGIDGTNGTDGTSVEFIYKLTKNDLDKPNKPKSENINDYVPISEGWTDSPEGIDETNQCEWVCSRKSDKFGNWGDWTDPSIWAKWGRNGLDGDGVQYIYKLNDGSALSNPTPEDWETNEYYQAIDGEYVPTDLGWTDEPTGVSNILTHEWVCIRKFRSGTWGAFSDPALWSKYSFDGYNGVSIRTLYTRTESSSDVPSFDANNINPGSIWGLAIPTYTHPQAIWSISAYVNYKNELISVKNDETGEETYGWQGPILVSGLQGLTGIVPNYKTYVYTLSNSKPNKPTSDDPKKPGTSTNDAGETVTWVDYPIGEGKWWQCIGIVNGMTELINWKDSDGDGEKDDSELEWSDPVQLNGIDGTAKDGRYWETRFAASVDESAPTISKNKRQPEGWVKVDSDTPAPTVPEGGTLWQTMAEINAADYTDHETNDNAMISGWCDPFRISGETGPKGDKGVVGDTGATGIPGVAFEVAYCLGTMDAYDGSNPTTSTGTVGFDGKESKLTYPVGWSTDMPTPTDEKLYVWCIQGKKQYSRAATGKEYEFDWVINWSDPFVLSGTAGPPGASGQMVYPAGIYNPNATYETTDTIAPYVYYEGSYYILNRKMKWVGAEQSSNPATSTAWIKMDMFDAIYSDIGVFKQALVGSAVFHGDYIFSQQGTDASGAPSTNYHLFDKSNPYGGSFRPNLCMNLATGEIWFGAGKTNFAPDGSGSLAGGNISWNKNGELSLNAVGTNFALDGSGSMAKGSIVWDSNGNMIAQQFTPLYTANDSNMTFNIPKVPAGCAKYFSIPYWYASRTVILFTFTCPDSNAYISYIYQNGEEMQSKGSISVTPSLTDKNRGGIGVIHCHGICKSSGTVEWYIIEDYSLTTPPEIPEYTEQVEFVSKLPSSASTGKLYVI